MLNLILNHNEMNNRIEQYIDAIKHCNSKQTITVSEFAMVVEEISVKQIKQDFRELNIFIEDSVFDIHNAIWKLREKLEKNKLDDAQLKVQSPSENEITNSFSDKIESSLKKAVVVEKSFDYISSHPNSSLLSIGKIIKDKVAFEHQIKTVNTLINNYYGRAIVADEVGLGKTITGFLWLFEYSLRNSKKLNTLILVPPNLKPQWCEKAFEFFELPFDPKKRYTIDELKYQDILIMSIDEAKTKDKAQILLERNWDCLIIDEAHDIRNSDSIRFRFSYSLKAKYKLLLTATPVHNTGYDIYSQVLLIRPGLLGKKKFFGNHYLIDDKQIANPKSIRKDLEKVLIRNRRDDIKLRFSKRNIQTIIINEWTQHEYDLYNDLLSILINVFHKHLKKAVMIQSPSGSEKAVTDFVLRSMLLLREISSHPDAALNTIKNSLQNDLIKYAEVTHEYKFVNQLKDFITKYEKKQHDLSKSKELLKIIQQSFVEKDRKIIIYVNFLKSKDAIIKLLALSFEDVDIYEYSGTLSKTEKINRVEDFWSAKKAILVSTDAGGQGLNLETADVIINYDYPWNPMKVEQRIGRIDRLSQDAEIINVYNLITSGTIEQYVYQTLMEKIEIFKDTIGDITSPIEINEEWERKFTVSIGLIILSCENASELKTKFEEIDKKEIERYTFKYNSLIHEQKKWLGNE